MKIKEITYQLKASVSVARELEEVVKDLVRRDDVSEEGLLEKIGVEELLADSDQSRAQKLQQLRWRLRKLRYPKLAEAEERFEQAKKSLHLSESIHLHHCESFEKKEIKVEIKSRSVEEFQEQVKKLNAMAHQKEFKDLFV